jgi:raffinose/stachyose/melibiose transport system permease protein
MTFIGLSNYIQLLTGDSSFKKAFFNTLIWVLLQSTVHVSIGTLLALILSQKHFGWKLVRTTYMIPNIISASALGVLFLNVFNPNYGIVNSILKALGFKNANINWFFNNKTAFLTVTVTWLLFAGLITILIMAEIMSIPDSLFEAAKIDGASALQTNIYITLPLLRNIIGTSVILAATSMLKEFELIFLTTKGGPADITLNLPLYLYKTALIENNFGYANTIGTILVIMGLIIIAGITKLFRIGESDV